MKKGYVSIPQDEQPVAQQQYMSDPSFREKATGFVSPSEVPGSHDPAIVYQRLRHWCSQIYSPDHSRDPLLPAEKRAPAGRRPISRFRSRLLKVFACGALFAASYSLFNYAMPHTNPMMYQDASLPWEDPTFMIKTMPSTESIRDFFHTLASQPHLAGSHNDKLQAEWTRSKWEEFGIPNNTIETYYPWINTPKTRRLAIVSGPEEFLYEAKLEEEPVPEDPASSHPNAPPTFHGYSADGNVTGSVVYVNYGRLTDFQFLAARGVNFTGTVALMRHGVIARGLKVRTAEEFGCVAALLYSDPMGDGPFNKMTEDGTPAKSYPEGPWRSPSSVERGTVHYLSILPGDMLTPGYAATENATRLDPSDTYAMPRIPSLPISWSDALPLFVAMEGLGVKGEIDWLGGLCEVNYYSGPSVAQVNVVNFNNYEIKPVWNVIGRIEGAVDPHRAIILGTHRDAFGFGGADAASGSAVLMEVARVFGMMLEHGWKPRRTIILASWDAQMYGSIGSTEWVEDHKNWLDDEAVAYINVDQAVTGPHFGAQASPLLNNLLYEVTSELFDPKTSMPLFDAWKMDRETRIPHDPIGTKGITTKMVDPLGGGSDYMAFFDHLGITSLSMGFHGDYGVSHSNYDSIYWMERFGDPTYEYHQLMVKVWALIAHRLADDVLLPFSPLEYASELNLRVARMADEQGCATLPELSAAVNALYETSVKFDHKLHKLRKKLRKKLHTREVIDIQKHKKKHKKLLKKVRKVNERLGQMERAFIDPVGLPGREWFKHIVYAPGLWSGYEAEMFPSIVEALDQGASPSFTREMEERAAGIIESARSLLKGKHERLMKHPQKHNEPDDDDDDDDDDEPEDPEHDVPEDDDQEDGEQETTMF